MPPGWSHPERSEDGSRPAVPKTIAYFVGQGASYERSLKDLRTSFASWPIDWSIWERWTQVLRRSPPERPGAAGHKQMSLLISSMIWRQIAEIVGIGWHGTAGQSFGDLTALWAAGALSDDDVIGLVANRGIAIDHLGDSAHGMMLVKAPWTRVAPHVPATRRQIEVACVLASDRIVVAGRKAALLDLADRLALCDIRTRDLRTPHPYHSSFMTAPAHTLSTYIERLPVAKPTMPVYCSTARLPVRSRHQARQALHGQMTSMVDLATQLGQITEAGGRVLVCMGQGDNIARLSIRNEQRALAVVSLDQGPNHTDKVRCLEAAMKQLCNIAKP